MQVESCFLHRSLVKESKEKEKDTNSTPKKKPKGKDAGPKKNKGGVPKKGKNKGEKPPKTRKSKAGTEATPVGGSKRPRKGNKNGE